MRAEIEQAVALLQRGDDQALEQALALLQSTVFSFSMRVCGQREDAEDTLGGNLRGQALINELIHPDAV